MKRIGLLLLTGSLFALTSVQAQESDPGLNYDYAEGGLRFGDYDGPDVLGLGARGSYRLPQLPKMRLLGSIDVNDLDNPDGDAYNLMVGAGLIVPLQPKLTDVVVDFGILHSAYDIDAGQGNADDDDTGVRLAGYVRHKLNPDFEVEGGLNYIDLFDDDDVGLNLGVYYRLTGNASAMLRYDDEADAEVFTVGARFSY